MQNSNIKKSFTLVELMIVIAILAILSAIVIFVLNPGRLFDNMRDIRRVTDITSIHKAINFMETWNTSMNYGDPNTIYLSLPDSNATCSSYSLPTLATGYSYSCKTIDDFRKTDGNGWMPINFEVGSSNRYLSSLPVDPVNDGSYFYSYFPGGSYELIARLKNSRANSINDGGFYADAYELGSPNRTNYTPLPKNLIFNGGAEETGGWNGVSSLSTDAYEGNYSFRSDGYNFFEPSNCFKVDRNKRYRFSLSAKSVGSSGLSQFLVGSRAYDKKNREISCEMTAYSTGTATTLAQPLSPGETIVYLSSAANWTTVTGPYMGVYPFEDYPNLTYTRAVYVFNAINFENNTITLSSPYSGVFLPAGTNVAKMRGSDSCTFNYVATWQSVPLPNQWTHVVAEIGGNANLKIRYGTVCLKVLALANFSQGAGYSVLVDNVKFELIANE